MGKHDVIHKTGSTWHNCCRKCRQRRTEPGNMYSKFCDVWTCCFWDMQADKNTHKQTDMLIAILCTPYCGWEDTHTNRFTALFLRLPEWAGARRKLLLNFMVQGEITEADTPTIRLGATPSGLISNPPLSAPIFTLDALPVATLPVYPGLGQAPNMLPCIPSGLWVGRGN